MRGAKAHRSPIWLRVRSVFTLSGVGFKARTPRSVGPDRSIFQEAPSADGACPGHRGHEGLRPGRDRVIRLDLLPGQSIPFSPQPGVAGQASRRSTHSSAVVARNPVSPVRIISQCEPDRVGDDRQTGRLILEDLQSALSAAPEVVGNPAHPDVSGRELACFGLLVPRNGNDRNRKRSGNRSQMTRSLSCGSAFASRSQIGRDCSSPRSVLAEPIQTRSTWLCHRLVPRDRVASGVPRTWESRGLVPHWPRLAEHSPRGNRCRRRPCRPRRPSARSVATASDSRGPRRS